MAAFNGAVSGMTAVLGVIGDPIEHSFSPQIHNTLAGMCGDDVIYVPFRVERATLADAIRGAHALGIAGLNVTSPHKNTVVRHIAGVDGAAKVIGAVNTLKYTADGYIGYNTDAEGVKHTLLRHGVTAEGKVTAVMGAGGSAAAAAYALAEMGAAEIRVINRTHVNALVLAKNLKPQTSADVKAVPHGRDAFDGTQIIIQTTTAGFGSLEGQSPVSPGDEPFRDAEFVLDAIYAPWETAFLKEAKKHCAAMNGFEMLIYQAVAAYEIFTGRSAGSLMETADNGFADELTQRYINLFT